MATTTTTPPPVPSLLETIPLELLHQITTTLDYGSALALSSTSRTLRALLLTPLTSPISNYPVPLSEKVRYLRNAETHFPQHTTGLACFTCLRVKPRESFSASNRRGNRGKGVFDPFRFGPGCDCPGEGGSPWQWGSYGSLASDKLQPALWLEPGVRVPPALVGIRLPWYASRFCWDCGVREQWFPHLEGVRRSPRKRRSARDRKQVVNDPVYLARQAREREENVSYLCHQCGEMKTKDRKCGFVPWKDEDGFESGYGGTGMRTICAGLFEDDDDMGQKPTRPRDRGNRKKNKRKGKALALDDNDDDNDDEDDDDWWTIDSLSSTDIDDTSTALILYPTLTDGHQRPYPPGASPLERLSPSLLQKITLHLPYKSRIILSQVSRHFQTTTTFNPASHIYPLAEKYAFLRHQEKTKHRATTHPRKRDIACYGCFRLRPVAKFSEYQLSQTTLPHFDRQARRAGLTRGDRLDNDRISSLCFALRDGQKPAPGSENDGMPFWKRRCSSCLSAMYYPTIAARDVDLLEVDRVGGEEPRAGYVGPGPSTHRDIVHGVAVVGPVVVDRLEVLRKAPVLRRNRKVLTEAEEREAEVKHLWFKEQGVCGAECCKRSVWRGKKVKEGVFRYGFERCEGCEQAREEKRLKALAADETKRRRRKERERKEREEREGNGGVVMSL